MRRIVPCLSLLALLAGTAWAQGPASADRIPGSGDSVVQPLPGGRAPGSVAPRSAPAPSAPEPTAEATPDAGGTPPGFARTPDDAAASLIPEPGHADPARPAAPAVPNPGEGPGQDPSAPGGSAAQR